MNINDTKYGQYAIYLIYNDFNNYVYVVSSISLRRRILHHVNDLKRGEHWIKELQKDWNENGRERFYLKVLSDCDKQNIYLLEQYYIDLYNGNGTIIYNYSPTVMFQEWTEISASARDKLKKFHRNPNNTQNNNTTGYKGVCFSKRRSKFLVKTKRYGKQYNIGYYKNPEEGYEIYKQVSLMDDTTFFEWWKNWQKEKLKRESTSGENHCGSKLSNLQREEVAARFKGGANQYDLAKEYGITQSQISRIANKTKRKNNRVIKPLH
mgnify:CR=1 FL=1